MHCGEDRHWGSGNMVASEWLLTGTKPGGGGERESRSAGATTTSFVIGQVIRKDSYWKIVE